MTRFSKLIQVDGKPMETEVREIAQSAIMRCPHVIMVAEHYRDDGTCKCNDPDDKLMPEWGYAFINGQWR